MPLIAPARSHSLLSFVSVYYSFHYLGYSGYYYNHPLFQISDLFLGETLIYLPCQVHLTGLLTGMSVELQSKKQSLLYIYMYFLNSFIKV